MRRLTREWGRRATGHDLRAMGGWKRVMTARDRDQEHRSSTPLELLFDLCFVVAVSQAGTQLHHGLADGEGWQALPGYLMVFFAIWWAWVNFTWFASAYDTDDVFYRLLTLLQIAGVLVLAAGVPSALTHFDFAIMTYGYVIMRVAVQGVVSGQGVSVSLVVLAFAALVLVFGLWWAYFKHEPTQALRASLRTTMVWAYTHFLIFSSVAALGATLSVAAQTAEHGTHVSPHAAALMVALPVAVFLIAGNGLHGRLSQTFRIGQVYVVVVAAVVVGLSWLAGPVGLAATVLAMAVVVAALLSAYLVGQNRTIRRLAAQPDGSDGSGDSVAS